jgi:hypothetical protein
VTATEGEPERVTSRKFLIGAAQAVAHGDERPVVGGRTVDPLEELPTRLPADGPGLVAPSPRKVVIGNFPEVAI